MLNHVSLGVRDIRRSRHFYDHALRPLGLVRTVDVGNGRGSDYGAEPGSLGVEFTITREPELRTPIAGAHLGRAPGSERASSVSALPHGLAHALTGASADVD
jgi:catechol 2,3-dioxygenase-like lactoylglutathione lyase family enzyme